jgi:hypothetical protein
MPMLESFELDDPVLTETCPDRPESPAGFAGVDSFSRPTLLPPYIFQKIQNGRTTDNGELRTRYGFDAINSAAWDSNKVQGLAWFDISNGSTRLLVGCVNQALYKWDGAVKTAISGYTATSTSVLVEMIMGLDRLYLIDGTQDLFYYDGTNVQNVPSTTPTPGSNGGNAPKGASIGCWHTNRLFLAGFSGLPDTIFASDILDTSVWNWAAFSFRAGGGESDDIVALVPMQGSLLAVLKRNSVYIYDTDPLESSAANWTRVFGARDIGCVGKRAWVKVGNDVHFFTQEGVRSIARAANANGDFQVELPISLPMQTYINRINWAQASKITGGKYRNFIVWFVPLDTSTEPDHMMVYNIRYQKWCGVWTGISPTAFNVSRFGDSQRMIIGDSSGRVWQWKDYANEELATTFQDTIGSSTTEIATRYTLKAFTFGEPESPKDGEFYWAEFAAASEGIAYVDIYPDETLARTDTHNLEQVQNQLPVNLPFDLAVLKPSQKADSLIGLENFKECYFEIYSTSKNLGLKRFVFGAFLNPILTNNE